MLNFFRKTALWILLLPIVSIFFGASLNQAVIVANDGKFPVMVNSVWMEHKKPKADGMIDSVHCVMTDNTRLNFLADIFNFGGSIESVGDLFIEFGEYSGKYTPVIWLVIATGRLRKKE